MRLKTFALAACISGFALASCNNGGDEKTKTDSTTIKTDVLTPPVADSLKKDTMKMDSTKKMEVKPIHNP